MAFVATRFPVGSVFSAISYYFLIRLISTLKILPLNVQDLLICLKELIMERAKNAGDEELADKFHPKILRMMGRRGVNDLLFSPASFF